MKPPRWLERLAGWLLPPDGREPILGDWHERYRGLLPYLGDILRTIPWLCGERLRGLLPSMKPAGGGGGALLLVAGAMMLLALRPLLSGHREEEAAGLSMLALALVAALQVRRKLLGPTPAKALDPVAYRGALQRRRDALRHPWPWFLSPVLVCLLLFGLSPSFRLGGSTWQRALPFLILTGVWTWVMQHRMREAASRLDRDSGDANPD